MQRAILGAILSTVLIVLAANALLFGADPVKTGNRFEGKFVTLYLKGSEVGHGYRLKQAKIEDVEGTKMLIGIVVGSEDQNDWTDGLEIYLPMDTIGSMFLMTEKQFSDKNAHYRDKT